MSKVRVSPRGRVVYADVFEPTTYNNSDPFYQIVLAVPKTDKKVKELYEDWKEHNVQEHKKKKLPKDCPIQDGDELDNSAFEGCYQVKFKCSGKTKPAVVNGKIQPIDADSGEFYPGCWAVVSFEFYAYDMNGVYGTRFTLKSVQKVGNGEPIEFGTSGVEAFTEVEYDDEEELSDMLGDEIPF